MFLLPSRYWTTYFWFCTRQKLLWHFFETSVPEFSLKKKPNPKNRRPQGLAPDFLMCWKWSAVNLSVKERECFKPSSLLFTDTLERKVQSGPLSRRSHSLISLVNLPREHFTLHQPELYCSWQWCQNEQMLRSSTRNAASMAQQSSVCRPMLFLS